MSGATAHEAMRLGVQPGEVIDRSRQVRFTWNGATHLGFEGDTIASALAADGVRVFSRSFKYHRPRGLLTAGFHEPGCMVQVGDEPNVRGAHRPVGDGMDVRAQNAWPSLRFDVKAANQLVARFLTSGFYYKTFMGPRQLWPAYERVLRRFAAGGVVPTAPPDVTYDQRFAHVEVLVAGGGPAGMAAAIAATEAGARVLLVEEERALGGHLRWGDDAQLEAAAQLRAAVAAAGVEVVTDAVVAGRYDGNWVAVLQRGELHERLIKARVGTLVVAPGLIERPYVFAGNDLPGVMLSTAVRRLVNLYAVRPGIAAVVFTANADGDAAVADLERIGVDVRAVVDARVGGDIVRARGRGGVAAVECGDGRVIECDLLVTATGWTAPTSLCNMAGARPVYHDASARFLPDGLPDDVLATGGLAGDGTLAQLIEHGRAVGRVAARRAASSSQHGDAAEASNGADALPALPLDPHPALFRGRTHGFVDLSEDVTSKELAGAVAEGYDSIELAKRYTTATMGPVQGKLETVNTVAVVAEATGSDIEQTGTTVWRPPYVPVSLGALAGRIHEPIRRSPMHPWHVAHGASPLIAGAWIRPDHYGDPMAEARNVRDAVGIIDVTPLGKLDLRGPDVPELLNQLYVNKWSKLAVGAVRYGVMCAEDGVVLDDGVTGHFDTDHYIMTTTSSGALAVWEWVENWLQTERPHWRVHVTPVTTAYASMNVAGPRSRELLARLVDGVDLRPEAFGYMRVRSAAIAGVAGCFMWRIGFTGELSYELHVPSGYGLHVWESVLAAGGDLGIRPFGVEAQRILRLEKGHAIVGQDTDGLTQAYGADLAWAIKLDKDDFAGKPELVWQRARDDYERLVGLQPVDGAIVPPEASQIVEGTATIVGRITSSRMSPTLDRSICLGYVAPHLADPGTRVTVQLPDGARIGARVMPTLAHVDPDGARLRAEPEWEAAAPAVVTGPATARSPVPVAAPGGMVDGWHVGTRRSPALLCLADHTPLAKTWIRAAHDGAVAAALPAGGRTQRRDDGTLVCGFGPGEWLALGPSPPPATPASPSWATELAAGESETVSVIDQTHGRVVLRLTGDQAAAVLAKICSIDLDDAVTPDGTALRTHVAAVTTDVVRDDIDGTRSYLLACEWSSGQYLHDEVLVAGAEFGLAVDGFHP
ncbi:MAG: (2Fe-2S)-binding protein [Actinobacteria bacterium]|nr:(2Fe-2S)-binding protein [Actinomycetota bacterium]